MRCLSVAVVAAASTLLVIPLASAADLPVKAAPAPVVVPPLTWAGPYICFNIGGAWGHTDFVASGNTTAFGPASLAAYNANGSPTLDSSGVIGGVQIGYNYQIQNWVFGVEADFNGLGRRASYNSGNFLLPTSGATANIQITDKADWLITARGRLGYAFNNWLLYATGGAAWSNINYSWLYQNLTIGVTETVSWTNHSTGWTVGGGLEWAWTRNWSVRGEYLYIDFGTRSTTGFFTPLFTGLPNTHSAHSFLNLGRIAINYKF